MMYAFRQQCLYCLSIVLLLICIAQAFRIVSRTSLSPIQRSNFVRFQNDLEQGVHENHLGNEQNLHATAARLHALNQVWARRSLYDPAFGDSWSNYFEKKRSLFDPAYSDWANSFKRSNE